MSQIRDPITHAGSPSAMVYASQLELALGAWGEKNARLARLRLGKTRPERRGWEHGFLDTLFDHLGQRTIKSPACFSPDGRRVALPGADGTVKVCDAFTGREVRTLAGHAGAVSGLAFSPDGKRLLSVSADATLKVWDLDTGRKLPTLEWRIGKVMTDAAFSPDGKRLLTGSGGANEWDLTPLPG